MFRIALAVCIAGCGLSHTGPVEEGLDAGSDDVVVSNCRLPLVGMLVRTSSDTEATALFVEPASGACRLDCPSCERPGWKHALTFEVLGDEGGNRVTTTFGGVGSIDSVSGGTFVGDGLVRDIPWDEPTVLGFKPDGGFVTFTLHAAADGFAVTVHALEL